MVEPQFSGYLDPGPYVTEDISPGALALATQRVLPTVIANGSRVKLASNEAIVRGLVAAESLTVDSVDPHTATLAERSNRKKSYTTVYEDGTALADSDYDILPAYALGTAAGPFDISSVTYTDGRAFCVEMDGKLPITIILKHNATPVAAVASGSQVTRVATFSGSNGAAATRAEVAAAINLCLAAHSAYGSAYASAASDATTGIKLTSQLDANDPDSDVRLFAAQTHATVSNAGGSGAMTALFGSASVDADTIIQITNVAYTSGATYTADYVSIESYTDSLANSDTLSSVTKVGDYAGVATYSEGSGEDYAVTSDEVDWSNESDTGVITNAQLQSLTAASFDLSTNDNLKIALDGLAAVTCDIVAASGPWGFIPSGSLTTNAVTATQLARNLTALIANSTTYGARYNGIAEATTLANTVTITSPTDTENGSVTVSHPAATDATTTVFGLAAGVEQEELGTGDRPAFASTYFVTYEYDRPSTDYNNPQQFFTMDQAFAFTGVLAADNPLSIAVDLAFRNGAPSVMLCQVDDNTLAGSPTTAEFQDALDAVAAKSTATDIICLSTALAVQTALMNHVEAQSSFTEGNYRRGWFGMARDTAIGDRDTAGTYVYRAARTLQVAADSPARGRLILVAPPGVEGISKTIQLSDGTETTLELDSTYLALACAARMARFNGPADSLVRKTLAGFDADDTTFTPWVRAERAAMASEGVTVVTFDAGNFKLLDPITTERAGAGVIEFEQISASVQKDNIVRKVTQALDSAIVGLVPVDLADFIIDIKMVIRNVLSGEIGNGAIGPFRDDNGNTRSIDLARDIVVRQDSDDPTKYRFRFFFNLRYPALRLFGTYSVDRPF